MQKVKNFFSNHVYKLDVSKYVAYICLLIGFVLWGIGSTTHHSYSSIILAVGAGLIAGISWYNYNSGYEDFITGNKQHTFLMNTPFRFYFKTNLLYPMLIIAGLGILASVHQVQTNKLLMFLISGVLAACAWIFLTLMLSSRRVDKNIKKPAVNKITKPKTTKQKKVEKAKQIKQKIEKLQNKDAKKNKK